MEWLVEDEIIVLRSDLSILAEVTQRITGTYNEVR